MPAGTITLTNNSAAVNGAGTSFNTELAAGDMIVAVVGGVTYTLPVKTVDSATRVTLIKAYDGPTQASAAWSAVPRDTLNAITAQLAAETAKALRGLNYDKDNWQKLFSSTGNITVKLPDGSEFTGPAWNGIITELNTKADKTALGSAAAYNVTAAYVGNPNLIPTLGAIGLGHPRHLSNFSNTDICGFFRWTGSTLNRPNAVGGVGFQLMQDGTPTYQCVSFDNTGRGYIQTAHASGGEYRHQEIWTTASTTVDSNGFIKRASPIARLSNNPEGMDADYIDGFTLAGCVAVNAEAEGVMAERISTGVYKVTGALGFAAEGWTMEVPQDVNGNRLCFVATETAEDGTITVTVNKRRFDIDTATIVADEPMDIPAGRWIDLRLEMPEDSIWNRNQKEMQAALDNEDLTAPSVV
jgi:hypothetical protein